MAQRKTELLQIVVGNMRQGLQINRVIGECLRIPAKLKPVESLLKTFRHHKSPPRHSALWAKYYSPVKDKSIATQSPKSNSPVRNAPLRGLSTDGAGNSPRRF